MDDRRKNPRHPYRSRIGVLYPDGRAELVRAHDISARGISIYADAPVSKGTPLRILVFAYDWRAKERFQIEARARVCHCVLDSAQVAFRLGLTIDTFFGDGKARFDAELERVSHPFGALPRGQEGFVCNRADAYPLCRRIKLALANGETLPGWTEAVTTSGMHACLELNLPHKSVHPLTFPILLPSGGAVRSIRAKVSVEEVVFRSMGVFDTTLRVFDYENDGQALLNAELSQRFPAAWAASNALIQQGQGQISTEMDAEADPDAEALQPIAAGGASKIKPRLE